MAPTDSVSTSSTMTDSCAAPDENGRTTAEGASLAGHGGEAKPCRRHRSQFSTVCRALIAVTEPHGFSGPWDLFLLLCFASAAFIWRAILSDDGAGPGGSRPRRWNDPCNKSRGTRACAAIPMLDVSSPSASPRSAPLLSAAGISKRYGRLPRQRQHRSRSLSRPKSTRCSARTAPANRPWSR